MSINKGFETINVEWTGAYPCLCHGEWRITVNGVDFSGYIPAEKINAPMNTKKEYQRWQFDENYCEFFESYMDGLEFPEWLCENPWIEKITPDESLWESIYDAICAEDWCHGQCGGCI